jgi:hypothetical protein
VKLETGTRKLETGRNQLSVRYDTFLKDYEVFRKKLLLKMSVNAPVLQEKEVRQLHDSSLFQGGRGPHAGSPENSTGRASTNKKGCVPTS